VRRSLPACAAALLLLAAARPAGAQIGFLAFGDSITAGVGDDAARTEKGYPPRLQSLLVAAGVQATVLSSGKGGETTVEGLTRLDGVLSTLGSSTEVMLLMEGTNDISQGIGIETIRFDLGEMARKAEVRGLSVVHATTIPRIPGANVDAANVTNLTLAETIRDLSGLRGRRTADPFEVFSGLTDLFTRYYSPETPDPVGHPNAAGYDQLAQLFFDVLRERDLVPPVPGITSPRWGAEGVAATAPVSVDVWDFGAGIDLTTARLLVNGTDTGVTPLGDRRHAQLAYTPATPLSGLVRVTLRARDLATPTPNSIDREVDRFLIAGTVVLAGDLDRSGRVDGADLVLFARRFGTRQGEARFWSAADLNGDAIVDGNDLALLASNFGKSSF
jgi:lysophospholipase L1-like esterase